MADMADRIDAEVKGYVQEIIQITHTIDLGSIRDDAVLRVMERVVQSTDDMELLNTKLVHMVRTMAGVMSALADAEQVRIALSDPE